MTGITLHRDKSGGLTRQAYANGIGFFRREGNAERISIDLPRVLEDPAYRDNLLFADGHSIDVPRYIPTVRIEGAVYSPTSVAYVPGKDTDYYVEAAGGHTREADKGRTFVQQPNALIEDKGRRPEAGAVVVVPTKEPGRGVDLAVLFGGVAQVLSAVTTIILVVRNF